MKTTAQQVKSLAWFLDRQAKQDRPITVLGTRKTLQKDFKPKERGGPLYVGSHELVIVPKPAKGEPMPQAMFDVIEQAPA